MKCLPYQDLFSNPKFKHFHIAINGICLANTKSRALKNI